MEKADVVVIGAGPSGSTAAYFLAKQGVDVILIDKNNFPREKACGDGLGPRSIQMMEKMGLGSWLSAGNYFRCDRLRLISNNYNSFEAGIPAEDTPYPHFYVVPRRDFDHKLAENASEAGAKLVTNCKATSMVLSNGSPKGIRATHNGEEIEISCKTLICADGTNGTFVKQTNIKIVAPHGFALRAYYSDVKGLDDCINIYIDERIPEGYAWIFPTSKTEANIGFGVSCPMMKKFNIDSKKLLDWFVTEKNTDPVDLSGAAATTAIKGAYLRMGYGRHNAVGDGVLLAGDAAGLINPLTGEGIAYAMESGEQAALAMKTSLDKGDVSARALRPYQDYLNKHFYIDHRFYEITRQVLSKHPWMDRFAGKGAKHPELAAKFISIMMSTAKPSSLLSPRMIRYYLL